MWKREGGMWKTGYIMKCALRGGQKKVSLDYEMRWMLNYCKPFTDWFSPACVDEVNSGI